MKITNYVRALQFNADEALKVNGPQVAGGRQPAIADVNSSTVDAAYDAEERRSGGAEEQAVLEDLRTKVNAILVALREHGLIPN